MTTAVDHLVRVRSAVSARSRVQQAARFLQQSAVAERTRWPLWLPVAFGAGIGVYFALPVEPLGAWAVASVGVALTAGSLSVVSRRAGLRIGLALLAAVALGFAVAKGREELVAAPVLGTTIGPLGIEGRVVYADPHGKSVRVMLDQVRARRSGDIIGPTRVRISFRKGADGLEPGDRIAATAVLMPPPGPAEPDAYDFARAAFFLRIGAVGYAYGEPQRIARHHDSSLFDPLATGIETLRWRMTRRIHDVLPGSTGSIASALITGDRGGISEEDDQALRDAGLAHVLAIAGLHMALVGLGLFWVVRAVLAAFPSIALGHPIKKWAALAALAGTAFYLVISGAGAPTIRAFTMIAMMLLAVLADRPALSMRSLALAATIILLLKPESLIEPGFQMSFAAVASLIAIAEWEQARNAIRSVRPPLRFQGLRRYVRGVAMTSFVGSIATVPYAIYHFDRATHYAVLGNLLAMPIMGFVTMPAAAVAVALMPFGLDAWPLKLMGWGIEIMLAVGRWVSNLPGAVTVVAALPVSALVLLSLGGLWCALWRRPWRWLGLAPMAFAVLLALVARGADVLVARDGETMALRAKDGALYLMRRPRDAYAASEWLKRDGDRRMAKDAIGQRANGVSCDALGCVGTARKGTIIAAPVRIDALVEDCARAAIVISAVPAPSCAGPKLVLDRESVIRKGGAAIWLSPLHMRWVSDARGARPWAESVEAPDDDGGD